MKITVALFVLTLTGCQSRGLDRLLNINREGKSSTPQLIALSCCRDNNAGVMTYPDFVPQAHRDSCELARTSARHDQLVDGNVWLALNTDCGHGKGYVGDQYYEGKGY